jgi:hypothetical protein
MDHNLSLGQFQTRTWTYPRASLDEKILFSLRVRGAFIVCGVGVWRYRDFLESHIFYRTWEIVEFESLVHLIL